MSRPRVPVAKIKQLIQLESSSLSTTELGHVPSLSKSTVVKYRQALRFAELTGETARGLDDRELGKRVRRARST
jgi:hypothetical protein